MHHTHVGSIEHQWIRRTLRTTPERLPRARHGVLRQAVQELLDLVRELLLKLQTRPDDALLEGERLVRHEVRQELLDLLLLLAGVLESALEVAGLRQVRVDSLRRLDEEVIEERATPLRRCQRL